jgi:colicin import membrane protein
MTEKNMSENTPPANKKEGKAVNNKLIRHAFVSDGSFAHKVAINNHEESISENGVWYSVALHFFILSVLILQNVFFEGEKIDYQSAIRVDIVGLPDKLTPEASIPAAAEETKPAPAPEKENPLLKDTAQDVPVKEVMDKLPDKQAAKELEAIKLTKEKEKQEAADKMKKKQMDALDKIKKMSALDKIKSDVASEQAQQQKSANQAKNTHQFKGNVLNPGTELTGLNKIQHENYVAELDKRIKENWTLPQWLANKDLKAQALIKIDENGVVVFNQIYKSSGNQSYDDTVIETINKSSPFPKPPEKFVAIVGVRGILIGFPE